MSDANSHLDDRRFAGTKTLYGDNFIHNAKNTHVFVIGVGGVGSWVVEALARTGIGKISLVDMDVVALSNINRQLPATTDTLGESKIEVMATRINAINPNCVVDLVDDFLSQENIAQILPNKAQITALKSNNKTTIVLDCVDDMNAKIAIALHCRYNKIPLIVSGGAGGKIDPTKITACDLKDTHQDPLLARLRHRLREVGVNKELKEKFNIKCVYSAEPLKANKSLGKGLACQGYGSSVLVTASIGFLMVAECLKFIKK